MSEKLKHQKPAGAPSGGGEAVVVGLDKCKEQTCKAKSQQMGFCKEHFAWFKFGMITKEGKRPVDFDKKMIAFQKHKVA
jgi:hypothetical protein